MSWQISRNKITKTEIKIKLYRTNKKNTNKNFRNT